MKITVFCPREILYKFTNFVHDWGLHLLHCCLLLLFFFYGINKSSDIQHIDVDPWIEYGFFLTVLHYALPLFNILYLPQLVIGFFGITLYNAFKRLDFHVSDSSLVKCPFICIRVVTRGDFPQLILENTRQNVGICREMGFQNFSYQIVTDKFLGELDEEWSEDARVYQLVVPSDYRTQSGALYKARALQYALEKSDDLINSIDDTQRNTEIWVLHLDEETLLTNEALVGVVKFINSNNGHDFGQGLVTYANSPPIVNWITTFADMYRVGDDMGKLRGQLKLFNKPLLSWKGSFVLCRLEAERNVNWDNGIEGSIAEDCYFALKAMQMGYSFSFVEGHLKERSPFSLRDFVLQRRRWTQGIWLVVHCARLSLRHKFLLAVSLYSWLSVPLSLCNFLLRFLYPLHTQTVYTYLIQLVTSYHLYMYVFGAIKTVHCSCRQFSYTTLGFLVRALVWSLMTLSTIVLIVIFENLATISALFSRNPVFYVVNKNTRETC